MNNSEKTGACNAPLRSQESIYNDRSLFSNHTTRAKTFVVLLIILCAAVYGYHAVLGNFFHGDDFVHLSWLSQAVKNPELIWRNFHSTWLDISTAKFYRPLISIFMVFDYLLGHGNGFGFHLDNLVCHLLNTVLLWLVILGLPRSDLDSEVSTTTNANKRQTWALSSAALFALYPLHPEAVSWITGRVDTIVTMFCLSSLWCYMRWRLSNNYGWLVAACTGLILGLLSKEMAIIMPALFVIYELVYGISFSSNQTDGRVSARSIWRSTYQAFSKTALFWIILVGYFAIRRLSLGTFVGGYDDSLFTIPSKSIFIKNWLHSITMTLVPMNRSIFGAHNPVQAIWIILLHWLAVTVPGTDLQVVQYKR
jgi:hypothetical protein